MMLLWMAVLAALLAAAPAFSSSAGFGPSEYSKGDKLIVKANELTSIKAQVPYPYYSQPFCKPDGAVNSTPGIWQIVTGDQQEISPYVFEMGQAKMCQIVCRTAVGEKEAMELAERMKDEYLINMALDKLPLVIPIMLWSNGDFNTAPFINYLRGYHVGVIGQFAGSKENSHFIHNHLSFLVKYRRNFASGASRIVGFEVKPYSVKHQMEGQWSGVNTRLSTCNPQANRFILSSDTPHEIKVGEEIIYTYDVNFQETDIKWESRWDTYVSTTNDEARWFSVVNSLAMILILSSMLAMTALRTLYREISKRNQLDSQEESSGGSTGTGWKLVHGDVFRPPSNPGLLCVYVGTGAQLAGTLLLTMVAALLGFVSPSSRVELRTTIVLIWVLMGLVAGYASSRLYKMFNGSKWKKISLVTASLLPGVAYAVFFVSNALLYNERKHSSAAIPLTTMLALVLLWCGISLPLVFVGSYIGFKKPAIEAPIEANNIPRKIPGQRAWYMHPAFTTFVAGVLPFGAVLNEFFLLLNAFWIGQFCHSFGLLFVAFVVLIVTCAETAILVCYFQLRGEDYRWWWRSFITTGCSAIYLFMYATLYFFIKLDITELVPSVMYFGYMLVVSYAFFLLTGTLGFAACFFFMRLIYSHGAFG